MRNKHLLVCLLFSGFAGLAWELLWVRLLSLVFGTTHLSFSTVLAVFFGGLALGSWLGGRFSARVRTPARAYALLEGLTGASGLALYPVLKHLGHLFATLDPGAGPMGALVRFAVSAPLLLIPTVLMGATLPFVSQAMIEHDDDVGRGNAILYAFNTFGAFLGAYLTSYYLLAHLGVFGSVLFAFLANALAAGLALAPRSSPAAEKPALAPAPAPRDRGPPEKTGPWALVAWVSAFLGGLAAIGLQVVWVRVFTVTLQGTVYGVGAVLLAVLFGIGVGSLVIARPLRRARQPGMWFVALQLISLASVVALVELLPWVVYEAQTLDELLPKGLLRLHAHLLVVFASICVPSLASGASLPLLVGMVVVQARQSGRALGSLYAANTLGSILGSLGVGFVLLPRAGSASTILLALLVWAFVAALGAVFFLPRADRRVRLALIGAAALLLASYQGLDVKRLAHRTQAGLSYPAARKDATKRAGRSIFFSEAEHANVAVHSYAGRRALTLNGLGQGNLHIEPPRQLLESVLVAAVPLAHIERPERALVVGLGAGVTVDFLTRVGVPSVEVVELEPTVADAVEVIFRGKSPLERSGVTLHINDARHHLRLMRARGTAGYDVITSMPAHPWVAAPIFTQEFFELARESLSAGGVFATWFGHWNIDDTSVRSLLRAFAAAFPYYLVYSVPSTGAYYLVGSPSPLKLDPGHLERFFGHPLLARRDDLSDGAWFLPMRLIGVGTPDTPPLPPGVVNTDDTAHVELFAARSKNARAKLDGFFPLEAAVPELVPGPERAAFFLELLERQLGTPGGHGALRPQTSTPDRAEKTLEAAAALLGKEAQAYFRGRLLLARDEREAGVTALDEVARAGGPLAVRAARFAAFAQERGSAARLERLKALPPSGDVAIALFAEDRATAFQALAEQAPTPEQDPVAWALLSLARADDEGVPEALPLEVAELFRTSDKATVLKLCIELTGRMGLELPRTRCRQSLTALERSRAQNLGERARQAMLQQRYAEAATLCEQAVTKAPDLWPLQARWLEALARAGEPAALERAVRTLVTLGREEAALRDLIEAARSTDEPMLSEPPASEAPAP